MGPQDVERKHSSRRSNLLFISLLTVGLSVLAIVLEVAFTTSPLSALGNGFAGFILTIASIAISVSLGYGLLSLRFHSPPPREVEVSMHVLFVALLLDALTGLTGLIGYVLSYFIYEVLGSVLILVVPLTITALLGYAILSKRFPKTPRRELTSIVLAVLGVFAYLSTATLNGQNALIDLIVPFLSLLPIIGALWLTLSRKGGMNYLQTAGIAMLIATVFSFLSAAEAILEAASGMPAYDLCPGGSGPCVPSVGLIIGIFSALGFAGGLVGSICLLRGKYHHGVVTAAVAFLSLSAFLPIMINVAGRGLLSWSIPVLCLISLVFIGLSKKGTLTTAGSRYIGPSAGGLGVAAIFFGVFLFSIVFGDAGVSWHPYTDVAMPLLLLGMVGILVSRVTVDAAHAAPSLSTDMVRSFKSLGSSEFNAFIVLLGVLLSVLAVFSAATLGPSLFHCNCGYTRTEQVNVNQVTFSSIPGQATFNLSNTGTSDVTIVQVEVVSGIANNASVSVNIPVPRGGTISLTVTFPNFTFQNGTSYDFTLITSQGNKFPTSAIR